MTFRVETLATEIIKPSSQTPPHLRDLNLSYLDQILIPVYTPIIFFYEAKESIGLISSKRSQICQHLKQSLSNTLTLFYPLAGRIKSGSLVDCNDAGAEFIEARVHARLAEVTHSPHVKDLKQFLPRDPSDFNGILVLAKVTFFECGGFSIGLCVSHKFADCVSIMAFVKAWAGTSRGADNISGYSFNLATYFPARDLPDSGSWTFADDDKDMAKCFVFDKQMLMALKRATTSPQVGNPTRVEAVSAFIWKIFIQVTLTKNPNSKGVFFASQALNLRSRANPPLHLENVFGNCYIAPMSFYKPDGDMAHDLYHELVKRFRDSIRKIDGDFIREAQVGDSFFGLMSKFVDLYKKGELRDGCAFTSWSRFPVYEVDFGWGNPGRVGVPISVKNSVVLVDTRSGEGIEAWVNMDRDVVATLEKQIKLICRV